MTLSKRSPPAVDVKRIKYMTSAIAVRFLVVSLVMVVTLTYDLGDQAYAGPCPLSNGCDIIQASMDDTGPQSAEA